jgi:hypothetical protein
MTRLPLALPTLGSAVRWFSVEVMTFHYTRHARCLAAAVVAAAGVGLAVPTTASAALQHLVPSATPAAAAGPASTYHSVVPFAAYTSKGRLAPAHSVTVSLASRGGLPGAGEFSAVALAVTVWQATKATTATVAPAGSSAAIRIMTAPRTRTVSGFAVVPVAANGAVRVRLTGGHARLHVVVEGYQQADGSGATFHPLAAATVLTPHQVGAGATRAVTVVGAPRTGLPPNGRIAAVALAVSVAHPSASTAVTVYPRGQSASASEPVVAAPRGLAASGVAIVKVGAHGEVSLHNAHGKATVSAKVEGYWTTDPIGARFRSVPPSTLFAGHASAMAWRTVKVASRSGLPAASETTAAVLSITAGSPSAAAYVAVSPSGHGVPPSGELAVPAHASVTTSVLARLGAGAVHVYASRGMSLRVIVVGWFGSTANGIDLSASAGTCASPLPTSAAFAVIGANDGQPFSSSNATCFTTEAAEAKQLAAAPEFYMNLADPGKASAGHWHKGGPEVCHVAHDYDLGCAYDYGYEAAKQAVTFASSHGMLADSRWWLDIETANSWGSHNVHAPGHLAANVADIHGALHYLATQHLPAGIYTETAWWSAITGSATGFSQVPVWGGGAGSRTAARTNCKQVSITGGPALLTQWFTNVLDDHDVAC